MPKPPPASRLGRSALTLRHLAEAGLFDALSLVARTVPAGARYAIGSALGTVLWAVDVRHRRVARDNVRLAYGAALPPRDARRLVLGSMRHFARMTVETLALQQYLAEDVDAHVRVEGLEHLREARDAGNGVIGFTGHLGHWELMSFMFGRLGMPAAGIARPLDNPYLEARLVRLRTLTGNRVIDKHGAFREALAVLRGGGLLGIWIDQRPKRGGIKVPFFGVDAYTTDGLARLALASNAAIMPGFTVMETDGSWRMVIEPPVTVVRTGNTEADTYRITADCTAILEGWVRRYPDQWLWTHRRWAAPTLGARADGEGLQGHGS